jgi:hypothetical protein
MVQIKFRMLDQDELSRWIVKEAILLDQPDINAVMTLCAYVSDFEAFLDESQEANDAFEQWLERPAETH